MFLLTLGHGSEVRKIPAHQITASDLNTFTNTSRQHDYNWKFDDELISLKETFGLCEGREDPTLLHHRGNNSIHVRTWLVNSTPISVERRLNCADNHVTDLWHTVLGALWYRVDSRLVTIDGLGMLRLFSSLCFQLSGWMMTALLSVFVMY